MKKKVKVTNHKVSKHFVTVKAITALLILLLAFSVLVLFKTYQQNIVSSGMFGIFITLSTIGMGLLVALLFLVNPQK